MRTSYGWLRWLPTTSLSLAAIAAPAAPASAVEPSLEWGDAVAVSTVSQTYVQRSTVKYRGKRLSAWILFNMTKPTPVSGSSKSYESFISLYAFDCDQEMSGVLSTSFFQFPNGMGESVYSLKPVPVSMDYTRPGSVDSEVLKYVCSIAPPNK